MAKAMKSDALQAIDEYLKTCRAQLIRQHELTGDQMDQLQDYALKLLDDTSPASAKLQMRLNELRAKHLRVHTANLTDQLKDEYYRIDGELYRSDIPADQKDKLMARQRAISEALDTLSGH
jgi:hypothetical protein